MEMSHVDAITQVRDESIHRLEYSGIPVAAERRLQALLGPASSAFTSTLSANEFLLTEAAGLHPVSQVMGSCVYQQATAADRATWTLTGGVTHSLSLSDAWNESRTKALHRMRTEAQTCGADVVVAVTITRQSRDFAVSSSACVEFVATGTAMRHGASPGLAGRSPVLTNLSMQDYWMLTQHGIQPVGVVARTSMVGRAPEGRTMEMATLGRLSGSGRQNQEIPEFSEALSGAYAAAIADLHLQAGALAADGIAGVRFEREQRIDANHNRIITVHAIGTAVQQHRPAAVPALTILPVCRLDQKGIGVHDPQS
jgi:uncharacterized protein YbjQ (UPF0145 family)